MLELTQHVQAFLHKHDRQPISLHEEMLQRQQLEARKRFEIEQLAIKQKEEVEVHVWPLSSAVN